MAIANVALASASVLPSFAAPASGNCWHPPDPPSARASPASLGPSAPTLLPTSARAPSGPPLPARLLASAFDPALPPCPPPAAGWLSSPQLAQASATKQQ